MEYFEEDNNAIIPSIKLHLLYVSASDPGINLRVNIRYVR